MTDTTAEREIRHLIDDWVKAVQAKDIERTVARHSEDMVMFDVPPPVVLRGLAAYRQSWPPFFEWQNDFDGCFEMVSLDVTAGQDVAFATALLRCGSREDLEKDGSARLRLTLGLRKERDRWLIAHEHHSFPDGAI